MKNLNELSQLYNKQLREISETSKAIGRVLREHYTDEVMRSFKSYDDFLEDVNYECENGGTGKLIFIKEMQKKYFYKNLEN